MTRAEAALSTALVLCLALGVAASISTITPAPAPQVRYERFPVGGMRLVHPKTGDSVVIPPGSLLIVPVPVADDAPAPDERT